MFNKLTHENCIWWLIETPIVLYMPASRTRNGPLVLVLGSSNLLFYDPNLYMHYYLLGIVLPLQLNKQKKLIVKNESNI